MAVIRWDPWGELAALQRDVNALFGRSAGPSPTRGGGLVPPIDAFRTDDGVVVRCDLPGLRPDDVDISVQDGMLSISGERSYDMDVKDDAWLRRERPVGAFERSFSLPEGTDAQGISASFDNGVLELHIPHPPERKPHRVQVTATATGGPGGTAVDVGDKSA